MDKDAFWKLIETSRKGTEGCEEHADKLTSVLAKRPSREIVEFDKQFTNRLDEAYRWDLWAVAYIIRGGCSDDSFEYFRCWLIGQGREYFEAALENPERAADAVQPGDDPECESLLYSANMAYEQATGDEELPGYERAKPSEPAGTSWDEEKVYELYPALAKKFE